MWTITKFLRSLIGLDAAHGDVSSQKPPVAQPAPGVSRLKRNSALMAAVVAAIAGFEGIRTKAYLDIVGVPTVCGGHTEGVKLGDSYTLAECKAMLGNDVVAYEIRMRACLMEPDKIPEKAYTAFLSLAYNVGTGAFCKSTVRNRWNAGDLKGACNAIPMWNKAGGRVVQGLVNRRAAEQKMCLASA